MDHIKIQTVSFPETAFFLTQNLSEYLNLVFLLHLSTAQNLSPNQHPEKESLKGPFF